MRPILLLLAGCTESGVAVHKNDPEVTITVPADGATLDESVPVTFGAQVSDRETAAEDLSFFWSLEDGSTLTGETTLDGEDLTFYVPDGLPAGERTVSLLVTDGDAATGEDSVSLTVLANTPPELQFAAPTDDARLPEGSPVEVDLVVADDGETDLTAIALEWTGASGPAAPTSDGHASFYVEDLPLGEAVISVVASDSLGATASASVLFTVVTRDADEDGYDDVAFGGDDCDDTDAGLNPSIPEVCDGIDNDCDGAEDEDDATDATTWYADDDGDTFGDPARPYAACTIPGGFVGNADDCDDTDDGVNPDATEVCNSIDDDCDGATDEDDAADAATWYADLDVDTYGDAANTVAACVVPEGYVGNGDDCDDFTAEINPDASEMCNGLDDDCDTSTDEADAVDALTWYADADADGFGDAASTTPACTEPAGYTADAADCDDTDGAIHPDAAESCNSVDDDCDTVVDEDDATDAGTWYLDFDADSYGDPEVAVSSCSSPSGYVANDEDCDDSDDTVSPLASELCDKNDADEDCDGLADDEDAGPVGTSAWYLDADADGYGHSGTSTNACDEPEGYVGNPDDCSDVDADVHPAADEVCNAIDDDCDTLVDDDDLVTGGSTWYRDSDGDAYGDAAFTVSACSLPAGHAANDDDCDDARTDVNPGASETCATAWDDDCDGVSSDEGAVGCSDFYADADLDTFGSGSAHCLCAATSAYPAETDGDCDDADDATYPGAPEICEDALDQDCDGGDDACALEGTVDLGEYDAKLHGSVAYEYAGMYAGRVGDLNDDGAADIGLGSRLRTSSAGSVWIFFGSVSGSLATSYADIRIDGDGSNDNLGTGFSGGEDVDGDGVADLLVGIYGEDSGGSGAGMAAVFYGGSGTGILSPASDSSYLFEGSTAGDGLGLDLTVLPSIDGDKYAELALGAYLQDAGGSSAGAVYVYYGPLSGSTTGVDVSGADARLTGEDASDYFGIAVADAGDFDGDGANDLVVGADHEEAGGTYAGAAYVFTGTWSGIVDASTYELKVQGEASSDFAGRSVAGAGDTDGDGYDDVLVGAYSNDDGGSASGAAYLVRGNKSGTFSLSTAGIERYGESSGDEAGWSVDGAGDVDDDGFGDIVIGAGDNDSTGTNAGSAYLYYGPLSSGVASLSAADAIFRGEGADDQAGYAVAGLEDTDEDGYDDLLIGAYYEDTFTNSGAAYVFGGRAR